MSGPKPEAKAKAAPEPRPPVDADIIQALSALQIRCMGDPALGPIVDALRHAASHGNVMGLGKVQKAARQYLRDQLAATTAPLRSEAIKILHGIAEEQMELGSNAYVLANHLRSQLEYILPDVVGKPALYSPKGFERLRGSIEKAMTRVNDAEGIVVAALVGCGLDRKKARKIIESAFARKV